MLEECGQGRCDDGGGDNCEALLDEGLLVAS